MINDTYKRKTTLELAQNEHDVPAKQIDDVRRQHHWLSTFSRLVRANAFVRGLAGSFAFISLFSEIVGLENYETARAINAMIIGWDWVAGQIGSAIGFIPFVPEVDVITVNIIVFMTSVTIPSLFGTYEMVQPIWSARNKDEFFMTMVLPPLMGLGLAYLFLVGPYMYFTGNFEWLKSDVPHLFADSTLMHVLSQSQYYAYIGMSLLLPFQVAMLVKPYRHAVLLVSGCLFTVQSLYFAPMIGDVIRQFADTMYSLN
ncbi:MAG: hypothetical protein AAF583_06585 [Pseudomonadota bacterium]